MTCVLQLLDRADGVSDENYGMYIVHYDPTLINNNFTLKTTSTLESAKRFQNAKQALNYWRQICPNHPTRERDGKPDRPLCAWSIEIVLVEEE